MKLQRTCARTIPALPWLLNGSLAAADVRLVREHLIHCPACRQELARTRTALAMFTAGAVGATAQRTRPAVAAVSGAPRTASKAHLGRVLRRLSWAAAAAVVVFSFAGVWTARERESALTARPEITRSNAAATVGQPEEIFSDNFDNGAAMGWRP